jgi:hypothetical protein
MKPSSPPQGKIFTVEKSADLVSEQPKKRCYLESDLNRNWNLLKNHPGSQKFCSVGVGNHSGSVDEYKNVGSDKS